MAEPRVRVLWICGAPGAGKSVAAWSLFDRLARAGAAVAYVDIDQLGMLYPETDDDPDRYALKSAVLDALIPGYAAAGARTLIVSGIVDRIAGPSLEANAELTVCLVSPAPDVLRQRLLARGWESSDADEAVDEAASLRAAGFVDVIVETDGLSVSETVLRIEPLVESARPPARIADISGTSDDTADILVITGPRAVGTSTIGFGLAMRAWQAGERVGFVDLQQLGFSSGRDNRPASRNPLAICQLAAMHRLLVLHGAPRLIISAHLAAADRPALRASFPSAPVRFVRLRADAETFVDHVAQRVLGTSARLAADDLLDASDQHQGRVVDEALAEQRILDDQAVDDAVVDVSRRHPSDVITGIDAMRSDGPVSLRGHEQR